MLVAMHVRAGSDYVLKCGKITNSALQARCLPDVSAFASAAARAAAAVRLPDADPADWALYITTDLRDDDPFLHALRAAPELAGRTATLIVALANAPEGTVRPRWTPIDMILAEQELCAAADAFVGNLFSSFSRTILERRAVAGRVNFLL